MKKKITIAIDAMGGDNSPDKTIHGLKLFLDLNFKEDDFIINLFGDKDKIDNALLKYISEDQYFLGYGLFTFPSIFILSSKINCGCFTHMTDLCEFL